MKNYRKVNKETLAKGKNERIMVVTRFDSESIDAFKYAVDVYGNEAKYTLLRIYSFEDALRSNSTSPEIIRVEMLEKLTIELAAIRSVLGESQPEIGIKFEFGDLRNVLEESWENGEFDLVVFPHDESRSLMKIGRFDSEPIPWIAAPEPVQIN